MVVESGVPDTYAWSELVLGLPGLRVGGGTDEVFKTMVAERVLGLPRRADRRRFEGRLDTATSPTVSTGRSVEIVANDREESLMRLENRVAIITGAGSGIGRATALRFAEEGAARSGCRHRHRGSGEGCRRDRGERWYRAAVHVDVARPESTDAAVASVVGAFGKLDILINNVGINRDASAAKITEEQWDIVLDVNLKGTFFMSRAAMAAMVPNKYGRIVSTASIAVRGNFGQANYAASKAGIIGLTRTLALEAARHGINVNCISPGPTRTPMAEAVPEKIKEAIIAKLPLKRLAEPGEIAAMHLFLASEDASFVTGQHIFCDGGASIGA